MSFTKILYVRGLCDVDGENALIDKRTFLYLMKTKGNIDLITLPM